MTPTNRPRPSAQPSVVEAQLAALITPKRAATRQRLLTAASAIIAERGLHGATVEDISEAAGFTRGAFYSNFADKEELFSALLFQEEEEMLAQIARVIEEGPPDGAGDVIDQLVEKVLAILPRDREGHLVHAEIALHAIRNPQAARELIRESDRFRVELGRLLETGLGRAGRRLAVPAEVAVAAVIAGFDSGIRERLLRDSAGLAAAAPRRTLPLIIRALSEPIPSR